MAAVSLRGRKSLELVRREWLEDRGKEPGPGDLGGGVDEGSVMIAGVFDERLDEKC